MIAEHKADPKQHHNPGHNPVAAQQPAAGEQTPAPLTAGTAALMLTNSSISPGPIWFEMDNPTALALTVGANTLTANVPSGGAGWLSQFFDVPLMCAVYTPAAFVADPGLPVPQSKTKLTNSAGTGLPAGAGITNITITPGTPPTITINIQASATGTVAAGSRWFVCSVVGV